MARPVTRDEIKLVIFSLNENKALGPDGYNVHLFKNAWSIIGEEVVDAIHNFFVNGRLLREINSTAIALVPKVPNLLK